MGGSVAAERTPGIGQDPREEQEAQEGIGHSVRSTNLNETDLLLEQRLEGGKGSGVPSIAEVQRERLTERVHINGHAGGETPGRQFRDDELAEPGSRGKPLKSETPRALPV